VPASYATTISDLLARVEIEVPELLVDIELNSLEDAYIKIAEDEIAAADKAFKSPSLIAPEDFNQEFDFYQENEGQ
jgi:hypothetical protein